MIKQIRTDQLQPGMYIHDLNCGWLDHPFVSNAFYVRDRATCDKIVNLGIRELYIDTLKGADVFTARPQAEVNADLERRLQEIARKQPDKAVVVELRDEAARARRLHGEASKLARLVLDDVRLGQPIRIERIDPLVDNMVDSLFRHQDALLPMARLKDLDDYNFEHSVGVAALLIAFGRAMKLPRDDIRQLAIGGLLHDIGKGQVPEAILNKPSRLTDDEYARMQSHVNESLRLIDGVPGVGPIARQVVAEHHERIDGSGYPNRLQGKEISLYGQMAAIVDVYDAITSDKVYNRGMPPTQAMKKLLEWSKHHFDPQLVQTFIRAVGIYPTGALVRLESNRMGVVVEQNEGKLLEPVVRVFYHAGQQHYVPPEIVDLAKVQDRIASCESYEKWKIDPHQWLPA
ncbi:HD-GYP domain-containing protein [Dechloromonas agitata]|uniref:HD-GYP domain-containing protein n=1 Tax=Dechloromonas agitata TaxID=73030 RepID=A0A930G026_9RHOO|nr:HD-GYP domain-containing protein [Dechloromonas agitata]MBF1163457.1 HD-GYP domain-containing protein [Dechloromonas agitata]MDE1544516.1 HD-GYP domain-containing protein [Dechloromonas agitata]